jgi:hypothetical protein
MFLKDVFSTEKWLDSREDGHHGGTSELFGLEGCENGGVVSPNPEKFGIRYIELYNHFCSRLFPSCLSFIISLFLLSLSII